MKLDLKIIVLIIACVIHFSCQQKSGVKVADSENKTPISVHSILTEDPDQVLVIAHRGDWRHAPENSLQAIKNCISMGVDMVEIDVRLTKDSIPILMHDNTLNRTTTGKGNVSDWTLQELKTLYLRNGANHATHHRIPTLEEALLVAKDQILLNLDKCYAYFDVIYPILKKTNTADQVLMKGTVSLKEVQSDFGQYLDEVNFMPVIHLKAEDAPHKLAAYLSDASPPPAIEFVFSDLKSPIIKQFEAIHNAGTRVWVNSLWKSLNAGYEDDMAVQNTDSIYGWYLKNQVSMIQTDRPRLLLEYIQSKQ